MTEKLYYQMDYIDEFDAAVTESRPGREDTWEVVLDRTAFYPEGGGQPYDMGRLNDMPVLEVHERNGEVVHMVGGPLKAGGPVHGVLDWERRYRNMQQHSGEHLLSGLICRRYGYDNVGFHMGKDEVTIDFNGVLTPEQVWELEQEANRIIYENRAIAMSYPDAGALAALEYRSKKALTGAVRIVEIPDADRCACCGTHVRYTGEIGMIKVIGNIHYKGGVRLSILCGDLALADYERRIRQDQGLSRLLSAKQTELLAAVDKLKQEAEKREEMNVRLYEQLTALKVNGYALSDKPLLIFEADLPAIPMRQMCTKLYEGGKGSVVMICTGHEGAYQYVVGSSVLDMRTFSRELNGELDGRGGGSSLMAQGTFKAAEADISRVFLQLAQCHKN